MDSKREPFKKGMIILWSGSVASIPGGWALCNGAGDTPNLRNRFIVGAGDAYAVNGTGGAPTHTHACQPAIHSHLLTGNEGTATVGSEGFEETDGDTTNFTSEEAEGLPPYFALAYIMKL